MPTTLRRQCPDETSQQEVIRTIRTGSYHLDLCEHQLRRGSPDLCSPDCNFLSPLPDRWLLLSNEPTICTRQHVKECTLSLESSQALRDNTKQAGRTPWLSLGGKGSIIRVFRESKTLIIYQEQYSAVSLLVWLLEGSKKKGFPPHPLGWTQSKCPGIWLVRYLFLLAWSEILRSQLYFPKEQRLQTS